MLKKLLQFALGLVIAVPIAAQTHVYPALDTNNTFTGTNSFNNSFYLPGLTVGNCLQISTSGLVVSTACGGGAAVPAAAPLVGSNGTELFDVNPYASGSPVGPSTAITSNVPAAQIATSGWTAYHVYGDSKAAGTGASSCPANATGTCYADLVDAAVGSPTIVNHGTPSWTSCDIVNQAFNDDNPDFGSGILFTDDVFTNDGGNDANIAYFVYGATAKNCDGAMMSWITTPASLKVSGNSCTASGFSVDNTYTEIAGAQSTTNGSTLTCSYTTSVANQDVVVWYRLINNNGGYFTWSDTGNGGSGFATNYAPEGGVNTVSGANESVGYFLVPPTIAIRAPGTYQIVFTVQSSTSGSNVVGILGVGVAPATYVNAPALWRLGNARQLSTNLVSEWDPVTSSYYNSLAQEDVQTLRNGGWPVYFVDVRSCLSGVAADMDTAIVTNGVSILHANNSGQTKVATCVLMPTADRPWPVVGSSQNMDPTKTGMSATYSIPTSGGILSLGCGDRQVTINGSNLGTISLPSCDDGKTITVVNETGGNLSFGVPTGSGLTLNFGLGVTLVNEQNLTMRLDKTQWLPPAAVVTITAPFNLSGSTGTTATFGTTETSGLNPVIQLNSINATTGAGIITWTDGNGLNGGFYNNSEKLNYDLSINTPFAANSSISYNSPRINLNGSTYNGTVSTGVGSEIFNVVTGVGPSSQVYLTFEPTAGSGVTATFGIDTTGYTLGVKAYGLTLTGPGFTGTTCLEQVAGVVQSTGSACGSGGGGSSAFSTLTGGTNTTAGAMVVGTGASINYVGSGAINASTLQGLTVGTTGSSIAVLSGANTWTASQIIAPSTTAAFLELIGGSGGKTWTVNSTVIGTFSIEDNTDGVIPFTTNSTLFTFNIPVATPSITINGSTAITSASSNNPQVVTCPTGGSGSQICTASGSWSSFGSVASSPQFQVFTQPNSGSQATAVGNTNFTANASGDVTMNSAAIGYANVAEFFFNPTTVAALPSASGSGCGAEGTTSCSGSTRYVSDISACGTLTGGGGLKGWVMSNGSVWQCAFNLGTVTSFSAGNLSPLFTVSVATSTSTPVLTFTLSNAAQNSVFAGPATGGAGLPTYQTAPTFSGANLTNLPFMSLTTTGTSGAATLSGGVLNIPQYSGGGSGIISINSNTTAAQILNNTDGSIGVSSSGGTTTFSCVTATTSQLGCVKVDGTTITISSGVISSTGGGSSAWSAITSGANTQTGAFSTTAPWTHSFTPAASTATIAIVGSPYAAGSSTTNYAILDLEGASSPTRGNLPTTGTFIEINQTTGGTSNYLNFQINGAAPVTTDTYNGNFSSAFLNTPNYVRITANGTTGYVLGTSNDTNLSRVSAGVIAVGNGAAGNTSGAVDAAIFNSSAAQTTVSCATSGSAIFSEPLQGGSDKKVLIHLSACLGAASYTYPLAFTNTPGVFVSGSLSSSLASSISASAVTITGATSTGTLILEDY